MTNYFSKFKFINPEVGPNYQFGDSVTALRTILLPFSYNLGTYETRVKNWFQKRYGVKNIWLTDTCRGGIYLLLKSLNLDSDSEVLVQGFSCIVVPNSVLQAGLKPISCDISKIDFNFDLEKIESKITKKTKVWIIQHNFGLVSNIPKILDICQRYNLILIEDCAHSLGAKFTLDDKEYEVGNIGNAAVFSFGRDKIISTTSGGLTIINPNSLVSKKSETKLDYSGWICELEKNYSLLENTSKSKSLQFLLYPILFIFFIKPFYHFGLGKLVAWLNNRFRLTGEVYTNSEKKAISMEFPVPQKYSRNLYPLLWNQLQKVDIYNSHRRNLAKIYTSELNLPFNKNNVYLRFPLYLGDFTKSENLEKNQTLYKNIKINLRKNGIFIGTWYNAVFLGSTIKNEHIYGYKKVDLPNIDNLISNQVINLPTNINTTISDAKRIIHIIKNL